MHVGKPGTRRDDLLVVEGAEVFLAEDEPVGYSLVEQRVVFSQQDFFRGKAFGKMVFSRANADPPDYRLEQDEAGLGFTGVHAATALWGFVFLRRRQSAR